MDYRTIAQQLGAPSGFAGAMKPQGLAPSQGFQYPRSPRPAIVEPENRGFGFSSLFQGRDLPFVRDVAEQAGRIPIVGRGAEALVSEFTSPFNIALAAAPATRIGGRALPEIIRGSGAPTLTGRARNVAGSALESISQGTFGQRLASEALIGTGAELALENLELPGYLGIAEPIIGGVTGLLALRYGQKTKAGKAIFGEAPVAPRKKLDPEMDSVDDHILTFGGYKDPSPLGAVWGDILNKVPFLGDMVTNPGHTDAVRSVHEEFTSLSKVQSHRLRGILYDLKQQGHLLYDESVEAGGAPSVRGDRTDRGVFDFGELEFFGKGRGLEPGKKIDITSADNSEEIYFIKFKNSQYNTDSETIANYMKNLKETVDDPYELNYRDIIGEIEDQGKQIPEPLIVGQLKNEGIVPMGEVLERHANEAARTYFPRIANFGKDNIGIRSAFQKARVAGRAVIDDPEIRISIGYRNMYDLASTSESRLGAYWYTDPEGLLEARTIGSLTAAQRKKVAEKLGEFGFTIRDRLDPKKNPVWAKAVAATKEARKNVKQNRAKINEYKGAARTARQYDSLVNGFQKYLTRIVDVAGRRISDLDESDIKSITDVVNDIRRTRGVATHLGRADRDLAFIKGRLAQLTADLNDPSDLVVGGGKSKRKSLQGSINALNKKIPKLEEIISDLKDTGQEFDLNLGETIREGVQLDEFAKNLQFILGNRRLLAEAMLRKNELDNQMAELMGDVSVFRDEIASLYSPRVSLEGIKEDALIRMREHTDNLVTEVRQLRNTTELSSYDRIARIFDTRVAQRIDAKKYTGLDNLKQLLEEEKKLKFQFRGALETALLNQENLAKKEASDIGGEGYKNLLEDITRVFPSLSGVYFSPQQLDSIESLIRMDYLPTPNMRKLKKANSYLRGMITTFDLSWMGIQGWSVLFSRPQVFMEAMEVMFRGLANGKNYDDYMNVNKEVTLDGVKHGLIIHDDFFRDEIIGGRPLQAAIDRLANYINGPAPIVAKVANRILQTSDSAFTMAGNAGRIELYKALTNVETGTASLKGSKTAINKKAIAEAVNQLTGVSDDRIFNVEQLGVFAPRYTRNMIKNILDTAGASNHPERAKIVRETMLTALTATGVITFLINNALGEETDFNPTKTIQGGKTIINPNFMTIKGLFDKDISLLGPYKSHARTLTNAFVESPEEATLSFARGKASPVAGVVGDIIAGRTLGGDPLEIHSLEGFTDTSLMYALSKVTPIALNEVVQGVQEEGVDSLISPSTLLEIMGFNARNMTSYDLKERAALRRFAKPYAELTGQERDVLRTEFPEMFQKMSENLKRRSDYDPKAQSTLRRSEIDEERIIKEVELYDLLQGGQVNAKTFRDGMSSLALEASIKKSENNTESGEESDPSAVSQYYATFRAAELAPGVIDWDLQEKLESDLMRTLTPEERKQVEGRSTARHDPRLDWYFNNKKIIRDADYFGTLDVAFGKVGKNEAAGLGVTSFNQLLIALRRAQNNGNIRAEELLERIASRVQKLSSEMRIDMRRKNPQLDAALIQNGYVSTSASR